MSNTASINVKANFIDGWKKRPYLRLSVYIVVTSLVLYWQYIFGNSTLVFFDSVGGDTTIQYVPVYNFFASAIKNGELTSYTFQYGLGNSIFSLSTYITDPFSMLGVLVGVVFGQEYIADSMVYLLILKHIGSGLLCLYFLKGFNFTKRSSMISAYIYAFSGYITTLGNHYFFAVSPVYYILLLIVLEKNIKGEYRIRNWIVLSTIVFFITINSLVTAYEMLLGAGFYTLFRVIYIYGKDIKKILQRLGVCLAFVICGVCIASFILFPVINRVSGSSRLVHPNDYFSLYEFDNIKSAVLKLFSNNLEGTPLSWYGGVKSYAYYSNCFPCFFTVMLLPMAAQFIWRTFNNDFSFKKKVFRMLPVGIILFAVTDKFIAYMFSCFVPANYHSYVYIFLPLYALLFADVLDNIKLGGFSRKVNYLTMIVSLAVIVWGGVSSYQEGSKVTIISMMFPIIMIAIGCFVLDILFISSNGSGGSDHQNQITKTASVALTAVLVLNLFGENLITVNYGRNPISRDQEHAEMLINDVADDINSLEEDNFFRLESTYYDGKMMQYSYSLMFPIRSTGYYDSVLDNDVPKFYSKMYNYSKHNMCDYIAGCTSFSNKITEDVLGIKYLLQSKEMSRDGWEMICEYPEKDAYLYKNANLDSAGLLFDSYITQAEADDMTFNERALGMANRLIIDAPPSEINDFAVKSSELEGAETENTTGHFNSDEPAFDMNGAIAYMGEITGISTADNKGYISADFEKEDSNITFPLNTTIINNSKSATQITFRLNQTDIVKKFAYYDISETWKDIPKVDPIIAEDEEEAVYTFTIPQTATHLALCVNESCEVDAVVSTKTVTATYVNEGIQLDNPKRGNIITGTVETENNRLLYLPIPFNKHWNAYIDGEKVDIMKANYAFMAVPISAGKHTVSFVYSNQTYHKSLKISIATFILMNGFFVIYFIIKRRRTRKRKEEV